MNNCVLLCACFEHITYGDVPSSLPLRQMDVAPTYSSSSNSYRVEEPQVTIGGGAGAGGESHEWKAIQMYIAAAAGCKMLYYNR